MIEKESKMDCKVEAKILEIQIVEEKDMEFEADFNDPLFQQCMKDMNEQDASFDSASESE